MTNDPSLVLEWRAASGDETSREGAPMHVVVAFASRHGATQGIAERIAETLRVSGLDAQALPARSVKDIAGYDAFVIGSAAYMFKWLGDATSFVHRHRAVLATKPVWLFSSGPLGTEPLDAEGRDQKEATVPKEIPGLMEAVNARGHRVFFGA
jgi:menaquinone-dependent protoporphyrinogen oxidase